MSTQHLTDDLCLDYLVGELPIDEKPSFEAHLNHCSQCRQALEEFRAILRSTVPMIATDVVDELATSAVPWSVDEGEKRLYAAIDAQVGGRVPFEHVKDQTKPLRLRIPSTSATSSHFRSNLRMQRAVAASLILAFVFGISSYRIGLKRGREQSQIVKQSTSHEASWRLQVENLAREREQIEASLRERETAISALRVQLNKERQQNEALQAALQSADEQSREQREKASAEQNAFTHKFEDEQALLAATEKKLDALEQAKTNDALRVTSLENQIQSMSQLLKGKDATIDEQQRFLASDRDIRDLMGARDLYIAEVSDVGANGKRKKPYGRVFYTKGKSLIFYAYDLDQEPDVKNASTFQAWGLRGPDRDTALNLGVMYVDNATNKRWALRFDDPEALKKINAVFVTVEPHGGSSAPRGRQVLFAYLGEEPNHP